MSSMSNETFPSPDTSPAFLAALVEYTDDGVISTDVAGTDHHEAIFGIGLAKRLPPVRPEFAKS